MTQPARDERTERYKAGLCIDCGQKPYAAGRVRCTPCHETHVHNTTGRHA